MASTTFSAKFTAEDLDTLDKLIGVLNYELPRGVTPFNRTSALRYVMYEMAIRKKVVSVKEFPEKVAEKT